MRFGMGSPSVSEIYSSSFRLGGGTPPSFFGVVLGASYARVWLIYSFVFYWVTTNPTSKNPIYLQHFELLVKAPWNGEELPTLTHLKNFNIHFGVHLKAHWIKEKLSTLILKHDPYTLLAFAENDFDLNILIYCKNFERWKIFPLQGVHERLARFSNFRGLALGVHKSIYGTCRRIKVGHF